MVGRGDCAARALGLADGPVLVERSCAVDRRLVGTDIQVDVVSATIRGDSTLVSSTSGGVVVTERLGNVVLDEWVRGPAVDRQVTVAVGLVVGGVGDGPSEVESVH